jgi:hypothetical protein
MDLFQVEKLARKYCEQYGIKPDDKDYSTALNAFRVGHAIGETATEPNKPQLTDDDRFIHLVWETFADEDGEIDRQMYAPDIEQVRIGWDARQAEIDRLRAENERLKSKHELMRNLLLYIRDSSITAKNIRDYVRSHIPPNA